MTSGTSIAALRYKFVKDQSAAVQPGEPRAAQLPWQEDQAEPSAAGRCASTGQRKRAVTADASDGLCGSAGFAPGNAATLWEQHPGPLRIHRGKDRHDAGGESTHALQSQDPWCVEECVLDFDEDSVEEGELVDDREEEDWWAQGGSGPANALSQSFQRSRTRQPVVGKALGGAHVGRRKAQERPPSLNTGEEHAGVRRVSVVVEASGIWATGRCVCLRVFTCPTWASGLKEQQVQSP
ncbi:hypothetical protein NDU88_001620 [Pleurodeles waltl]|uniref:Uncharacterized protein n=1 Tax=Pleurodeles waltl TaxID=8319 RepID=A0AAV7P4G7_PLEWA|nr:hypothetical protein NDU88_001620 [Pleurodeles waltl]